MDTQFKSQLGKADLWLPRLGFGGGTMGDPVETISEEQATATMAAAYDRGITYFDTSPFYGNTKSEHRIGGFLRPEPNAGLADCRSVAGLTIPTMASCARLKTVLTDLVFRTSIA